MFDQAKALHVLWSLLLAFAIGASGCAHNSKHTQWGERTEVSRAPLGDPHKDEQGRCMRDYRVEYETVGTTIETTNKLRSSVISVAALAVGTGAFFFLALLDGEPLWVLASIASGLSSVVWGVHTLIVSASADAPVETTKRITEDVTLADSGCDTPAAATVAGAAGDCSSDALVDRKLLQLEELRTDGLIEDAAYEAERESIQSSRCPRVATDIEDPRVRLQQLEQLRADGLVTEEEYQQKRKVILDAL